MYCVEGECCFSLVCVVCVVDSGLDTLCWAVLLLQHACALSRALLSNTTPPPTALALTTNTSHTQHTPNVLSLPAARRFAEVQVVLSSVLLSVHERQRYLLWVRTTQQQQHHALAAAAQQQQQERTQERTRGFGAADVVLAPGETEDEGVL